MATIPKDPEAGSCEAVRAGCTNDETRRGAKTSFEALRPIRPNPDREHNSRITTSAQAALTTAPAANRTEESVLRNLFPTYWTFHIRDRRLRRERSAELG